MPAPKTIPSRSAATTPRRTEPTSDFAPLTAGRVLDVRRVPTQLSLFSRVPAAAARGPRNTD